MGNAVTREQPIAEAVRNLVSPTQSGLTYVNERTLIVPLASGDANDFAAAVQNPETVDCILTEVILDITTAGGTATAALRVDVVANATTGNTGIIAAQDANAAAVESSNRVAGQGTGNRKKWNARGGANDFVTCQIITEDATALAGKMIIRYIPLE
jgi:hypothetical protein